METFHWKVRPDMNVVSEPKVVTVKLGDGYEQRRAAGLNNQLSTYSVTIRVRKCEHPSLKAFLERHGAALKVVYDLGKKAAADFMQQQARDGGRLSGAYR
ncbi:hypothetical protein DO98_18225 [Escherichia coli]|uniref:phage tail protein n=1 Tax=Escherichia coli TaxID=562 RepID=UPI00049ECB9F|nr:phage tail protein [Escherichia coli]KDO87695.1 hypothetical protein DO98_18225 [Escherichia coli]